MSFICGKAGTGLCIERKDKEQIVAEFFSKVGVKIKKLLLLPPDLTRFNSNAGELTEIIYEMLAPKGVKIDIMPALGTHFAMTEKELRVMFGSRIPLDCFKVHDWRNSLQLLGKVPGPLISEWSEGKLDYSVNIEVNKILFGGYDMILSIGQIVPHEVVGMANYTKNVCVGVGGQDTINKSHFLGAVYGMERIMGRIDTPVRKLFNYGAQNFMHALPIYYVLTVMQKNQKTGKMEMRGLYTGNDMETFMEGAKLSQKVNLDLLDKPLKKVVVHLDHEEFKSTWLGNKSVYRTRMAMADDGELIVLAPGLKEFGEDPEIDRLIRKYGYRGTPATLDAVKKNLELQNNLSAAAHLIHGSSEGRFKVTYCPGPGMSLENIRNAGFNAEPYGKMAKIYDHAKLKDGFNTMPDGEEIFFISNPGLGLWALKEKFS
ncbi:MAG TPA: D-mannonate epimerase [Lentisphaeria bacterium]|nr:MAG: D-mannonate epimerase [Lentisphaerae bacterium GWF2_50_93]HCE44383.1 D-mannonate epimerase [Lentisphaeria bacterium]